MLLGTFNFPRTIQVQLCKADETITRSQRLRRYSILKSWTISEQLLNGARLPATFRAHARSLKNDDVISGQLFNSWVGNG